MPIVFDYPVTAGVAVPADQRPERYPFGALRSRLPGARNPWLAADAAQRLVAHARPAHAPSPAAATRRVVLSNLSAGIVGGRKEMP
jgi:hypothetical protein